MRIFTLLIKVKKMLRFQPSIVNLNILSGRKVNPFGTSLRVKSK